MIHLQLTCKYNSALKCTCNQVVTKVEFERHIKTNKRSRSVDKKDDNKISVCLTMFQSEAIQLHSEFLSPEFEGLVKAARHDRVVWENAHSAYFSVMSLQLVEHLPISA